MRSHSRMDSAFRCHSGVHSCTFRRPSLFTTLNRTVKVRSTYHNTGCFLKPMCMNLRQQHPPCRLFLDARNENHMACVPVKRQKLLYVLKWVYEMLESQSWLHFEKTHCQTMMEICVPHPRTSDRVHRRTIRNYKM